MFALDLETRDPNLPEYGPSWFRGGGYVTGFSMAWQPVGEFGGALSGEKRSCYLPIRHEGGDNLDPDIVIAFMRDLLKDYKGTIIFANAFYDLGWLRAEGIPYSGNIVTRDVQMQEALLDENKFTYRLDALAQQYLNLGKDEKLLQDAAANYGLDPKKDMWRLPARYVGPYAEADAERTFDVYLAQVPLIGKQKVEKLNELEHDNIPLLLDMRWQGVRIDVLKAEETFEAFKLETKQYEDEIKHISGRMIDIWSADSCAAVFDVVGVPYRKLASGRAQVVDDWLKDHEHPVVQLVAKARKSHKAGYTFCKGMVLDHTVNGRIHCAFHPLRSDDGGTVSGRFSSSDPNLQQVPKRDPAMNTKIRGLFLPEEGEQWAAIDYSQQEPRLTVHYGAKMGFKRAAEVAKRYREDPSTDYHNLMAELCFGKDFTKIQRRWAKDINLGLAYGMGGAKLCKKLGFPTIWKDGRNGKRWEAAGPEGQAIIDKYHEEVPYVKQLTGYYDDIAKNEGAIRTLAGRLCRFDRWEPRAGGRALPHREAITAYGAHNIKRAWTYTALNRKIQGGCADMMKIAMRNLYREGIIPLVTIHDELGVSVKNKEQARYIADIMSSCVPLEVPLKVEIDFGSSWGEAKPMVEDEDEVIA